MSRIAISSVRIELGELEHDRPHHQVGHHDGERDRDRPARAPRCRHRVVLLQRLGDPLRQHRQDDHGKERDAPDRFRLHLRGEQQGAHHDRHRQAHDHRDAGVQGEPEAANPGADCEDRPDDDHKERNARSESARPEADRDQDRSKAHDPDAERQSNERDHERARREKQQVEDRTPVGRRDPVEGDRLLQDLAQRLERPQDEKRLPREREQSAEHEQERQGPYDGEHRQGFRADVPLAPDKIPRASGGSDLERR